MNLIARIDSYSLSNSNAWAPFPGLSLTFCLETHQPILFMYNVTSWSEGDTHLCTKLMIDGVEVVESRAISGNTIYHTNTCAFPVTSLGLGTHRAEVFYRTPGNFPNRSCTDWNICFLREARPLEVSISVNGRILLVPSSWSILRACRENGIYVPTLCHHPAIPPTGRCGVCVVHVEGHNPPLTQACKTIVEQGMTIVTNSPEVAYQSQVNLREFLGLRSLESLPLTAEVEDLVRFAKTSTVIPEQHQQYAVVRNQSLCIACTRCVRACSGIQNMSILSIDPERPLQPISFDGDKPLHLTNCVACGQCTVICPTGAVKERCDVGPVEAELSAPKASRKIMILQTAPAGRLSVGELMGEEPGKTDIKKVVAAAHSIGFDFVFDTTFSADTCATLEAEELVDRVRENGPFPMFTSCCPGWVNLVEKKYPHLRPLLSRCKSPMMMLASMIRSWMEGQKTPRSKYCVVAMMPCVAKKEEICRTELLDPQGNRDVDVVLTVREMADLFKAKKVDWQALPGKHKGEYDEPFGVSSGAGALFGTAGGVTEAAMRVAYTLFTKEVPDDPSRSMFEECRRMVQSGEWVDAQIDMTPGRRHRRPMESFIVHGCRSIQQYLEDSGLDVSVENYNRKGHKVFIECMACPGGCVGGGGQPRSLDEHIIEKRRSAVHRTDRETKLIAPASVQREFQQSFLQGITSQHARELLEYEPPFILTAPSSRGNTEKGKKPGSPSGPASSKPASSKPGSCSGSGSIGRATAAVGDIAIIYGSQGGITATFAKHLLSYLSRSLSEDISIHSMDHFLFERLVTTRTIILLTSTWESEEGLMPQNAKRFWTFLRTLPLYSHTNSFSATKFAVCGFGSSKYPRFCGFAIQLNDVMLRLGSHQLTDFVKVDVERADKGKKPFLQWTKRVCAALQSTDLPRPNFLLVPSITPGGKAAPKALPLGYQSVTVSKVQDYKDVTTAPGKFFYVEFDTGKFSIEPQPDQYVFILPNNPRSEVETLVNAIYPGMLNTPVSLIPTHSHVNTSLLPPHLTVRQLFEQFIDLSRKPSLWFMQQIDSLVEETDSTMKETLQNPEAFNTWQKDKTYFTVLKQYKSVIPSIEILISMLPLMNPRSYTPIHQDHSKLHTLAICVKMIEGGLCSRMLINSKKGDKVMLTVGTSDFQRPNEDFLPLMHGKPPTRGRDKELSHTHSSSKFDTGAPSASTLDYIPPPPLPPEDSPKSPKCTVVAPEEFPLQLSAMSIFGNITHRAPVDEVLVQTIDLTNTQKEKYRFALEPIESERFTLQFEPSGGIIKPKFMVSVKVQLTIHCTTIINTNVQLTCEPVKHADSETIVKAAMLPLKIESKLSPKIDFAELNFTQEIGSGAFGTVSRGEWRGQEVAIKMLTTEEDKYDMKQFENECMILQDLRCPNILGFIGFCALKKKHCIVTEFMPLGSLQKYIHTKDLSPGYKIRVAQDTAKALSFLHHAGLMHRDIKPGNILITSLDPKQSVVCKISDFGSTREVALDAKNLTSAIGTPLYMAPEVLDGKGYTTSADVYSFGVTLWELYSCKAPYSTPEFAAAWRIAQFVTSGKRLPIPPDTPQVVVALITSCWEQVADRRPNFEMVLIAISTAEGARQDGDALGIPRSGKMTRHGDIPAPSPKYTYHKKDDKKK